MYLFLKAALTGAIVVGVSETAKRSSLTATILASLPLTSILAMVWLYANTKNIQSVKNLSVGIFWMVLPSLFFFLIFPMLIRIGLRFYPALLCSIILMACLYALYVQLLKKFGVAL